MYFSENFLLCHDEEFPSFKMMNGMSPEANFLDISPCGGVARKADYRPVSRLSALHFINDLEMSPDKQHSVSVAKSVAKQS